MVELLPDLDAFPSGGGTARAAGADMVAESKLERSVAVLLLLLLLGMKTISSWGIVEPAVPVRRLNISVIDLTNLTYSGLFLDLHASNSDSIKNESLDLATVLNTASPSPSETNQGIKRLRVTFPFKFASNNFHETGASCEKADF